MTGPETPEQRHRRIWRATHPDDRELLNEPQAIAELPDIATYRPPDHYQLYRAWWGRPWPVHRDTGRDPDIPTLPDISHYHAST